MKQESGYDTNVDDSNNWNDEIEKFKRNELFASDAQLLGRVTYQGFAEAWPSREGEYADRLNSLPKYVVSTSLEMLNGTIRI